MDWPTIKRNGTHFALSLLAVAAMAVLQELIDILRAHQPDLFAGASQTAAAFSAIKFLGR